MKKIAYIELDTHAEILNNFMNLMEESIHYKVDYFVSEKIKKQINSSHGSNIILCNRKSLVFKLFRADYDLVIIGTAHRYFKVFLHITEHYNTAIITHNQNFSKRSWLSLVKSIFKKDSLYRIKLLLRENLLIASTIYRKAKWLLVLDPSMENFRQQFFPVFFIQFLDSPENKILKVAIPGAVSQERRDYTRIFKVLKKSTIPIQFVFAGKADGKELEALKKIENNLPNNISIKYFTEKLSQDKFDKEMQSANVLWCPIQGEIDFFGGKEIYGKTKISGNIGDAIKYGKPAIFPANYLSDYPFVYREEEDIEQQFLRLSQERQDFSAFRKMKVLEDLEKVLSSLIDS